MNPSAGGTIGSDAVCDVLGIRLFKTGYTCPKEKDSINPLFPYRNRPSHAAFGEPMLGHTHVCQDRAYLLAASLVLYPSFYTLMVAAVATDEPFALR